MKNNNKRIISKYQVLRDSISKLQSTLVEVDTHSFMSFNSCRINLIIFEEFNYIEEMLDITITDFDYSVNTKTMLTAIDYLRDAITYLKNLSIETRRAQSKLKKITSLLDIYNLLCDLRNELEKCEHDILRQKKRSLDFIRDDVIFLLEGMDLDICEVQND